MTGTEVEFGASPELTAEMVRAQLDLLVRDPVFRASKRSVAFLRYVVEQALAGMAEHIKERSIGIEVFGRDPSYDTNTDHVVRTAAAELRKRLATYYVDEKHRSELRMAFVPGSYVPRFTLPGQAGEPGAEAESIESPPGTHSAHIQFGPVPLSGVARRMPVRGGRRMAWVLAVVASMAVIAALASWNALRPASPQELFWKPVLDTPGPVLLVVGDHPNGPPTLPSATSAGTPPVPIASTDFSQTVPFADTVTVARVAGILESRNKQVAIHQGAASSFSDLRQGAAVLIGAFNNEWSLRLTRPLRYSLAMDEQKHLVYIRDATNPSARVWSWRTDQSPQPVTGANSPKVRDYALISRIQNSETGHVVVIVGGLYTYGTEAAGEFLVNPELMKALVRETALKPSTQRIQIVLGTTVTDGTPGPPQILAVSVD